MTAYTGDPGPRAWMIDNGEKKRDAPPFQGNEIMKV